MFEKPTLSCILWCTHLLQSRLGNNKKRKLSSALTPNIIEHIKTILIRSLGTGKICWATGS